MSFSNIKKRELSQLKYAVAGGLSGASTRLLCQPLDVVKIRFQLQVEPIRKRSHYSKYKSLMQAVNLILKEEGFAALWKGHVPAQALSVVYGMSQFWCYEGLIKSSVDLNEYVWPSVIHFSCGTVAGSVATLFSMPMDVVRTRLIGQDISRGYSSIQQAFTEIIKHEGYRGLFRGMVPSILQIAPQTGAQFMFYNVFSKLHTFIFDSHIQVCQNVSFSNSLFAGGMAGLCAKTVVYPLDLAKKRLQIQGFHKHRTTFGAVFKCSGLWNCLVSIVKHEGFAALYKGLGPSLVKAVFTTALHFSFYEQFCKLLI